MRAQIAAACTTFAAVVLAACAQSAGLATAPADDPDAPLPPYLAHWGGLFIRTADGKIVDSPEADVAVAKSYARSRVKGPLAPDGERLTILIAKTAYAPHEEVRVVHVHEATREGVEVCGMGPKEVFGETIDGRGTTRAEFVEGVYDGVVEAAPAVDFNYEITSYRLAPGRHVIRWSQRTMSSDLVLSSNEIVVEVR